MAIQLYRKGNTHVVQGIECELCNFPVNKLEQRLSEGWFKTPQEIENGVQQQQENEDGQDVQSEFKEEDQEESESVSVSTESLNPIRLKAKEAGIEGWDTKRIKTLEALLSGDED